MKLSIVPYVLPTDRIGFHTGPKPAAQEIVKAGTEVYRIQYDGALGLLYLCYQYISRDYAEHVTQKLDLGAELDGNDLLANWRRWDDHTRFYTSTRESD